MKKILIALLFFCHLNIFARSLSLSLNDTPNNTSIMDPDVRADLILAALKKHGAKAVFYVNTNTIDEATIERIKRYKSAGHIIGSLSHSHISANKVRYDIFLVDMMAARSALNINGIKTNYFRYPFLHRGRTIEDKESIRKLILAKGYKDGFVTIPTPDNYMDKLYQKAVQIKSNIDKTRLKNFYVNIIKAEIEHYDALAFELYQRSPNHVLQLHQNDLTAQHLDALLTELNHARWVLCKPEESYSDQHLSKYPHETVMKHEYGRIVAHAAERKLEREGGKKWVSDGSLKESIDYQWEEIYQVTHPFDHARYLIDRAREVERKYKLRHPMIFIDE